MFFLYGYGLFSNTHFTPLNMSFQYGATVNKKKKQKKPRQQYSSQKFSKTVQNLLQHDGKKKYEVRK